MQPLVTTSLREQARRAIRSSIVTGELVAGEIYTISHFTKKLGVSATPIREALFDLANAGLLEPLRNRGFRVPHLSEQDLDELMELRILLEVPTVTSLAGRLTEQVIEKCEAFVERIEASAAIGDLVQFLEWDRKFHLTLLAAAGNQRLVALVRGLRDESRLTGLRDLVASSDLMQTAAEHALILQALLAGDREQVEDLMRRHLHHTRGVWAGRMEPDNTAKTE